MSAPPPPPEFEPPDPPEFEPPPPPKFEMPPDAEVEAEFRIESNCGTCGAKMTWKPETESLYCEYCETSVPVPRGAGTILERRLEDAGSAARGLGLEMRSVRCGSCGAKVAFDASSTSETCVYCGSTSVLDQEVNRNAIRPESLVPLSVGQERAKANLKRWLGGLWFRPNDLKKAKKFEATGIYVPFWTFDCRVESDWWAQSGTYYWVTERYTTVVNGKTVTKTRRVRKTRWRPASGSRRDAYDDLLVPASQGISAKLLAKLGDFDTSALVPYRPEYLAGFRAEEYQFDLEAGWVAGRREVEAIQRSRCARDVPGDTHRNLRVRNWIGDIHWKHVLLPIWSMTYRYKGKAYPVLVHGQTGRVVGEAPLSWVKILLLVLFLVAIGVGIFLLVSASR